VLDPAGEVGRLARAALELVRLAHERLRVVGRALHPARHEREVEPDRHEGQHVGADQHLVADQDLLRVDVGHGGSPYSPCAPESSPSAGSTGSGLGSGTPTSNVIVTMTPAKPRMSSCRAPGWTL